MKLAVLICGAALQLAGATNAPSDVAAPPPGARVDGSGVSSVQLERTASTDHPSSNDCVVIRFTAWRRYGSLFSTSGPHGAAGTQCLSALLPGLDQVLKAMSPGEHRRVWLPPQTAPHRSLPDDDSVPAAALTVDLELIAIRKGPPTPDHLSGPPADARHLRSGVSLQVLAQGVGTAHAKPESKLTLTHSEWNTAGKLLESTVLTDRPATLPMSLTPPAWREALGTMVVGEKVRLWVPAALVPGKPSGDRVYDLELLRID